MSSRRRRAPWLAESLALLAKLVEAEIPDQGDFTSVARTLRVRGQPQSRPRIGSRHERERDLRSAAMPAGCGGDELAPGEREAIAPRLDGGDQGRHRVVGDAPDRRRGASAPIESLEIDCSAGRVVAPGEAYPGAVPGQVSADGLSACVYRLRLRGCQLRSIRRLARQTGRPPCCHPASNQVSASPPWMATSGYFDSCPSSLVSRVTEPSSLPPSGGRECATRARNSSLARVCQTASQTIQATPSSSMSRFTFQVVRCATPRRRGSPIGSPASFHRADTFFAITGRRGTDPGDDDLSTIGGENRVAACAGQGVRPDVHACGGPEPTRAVSVASALSSRHGDPSAGEGGDARFA